MKNNIAFIWMVNTPDRLKGLSSTLFFINRSVHKHEIDIWIAASTWELEHEVRKVLATIPDTGLHIQVCNVNDNSWHGYKKKLASIIHAYEYFIKCDDDLFYSNHVLDYFIEHRHELDNDNNIWLFPTSSINSLTTDMFIEEFVEDEHIRQGIYADFGAFNYHNYPQHNGTDDLGHLKQFFMSLNGQWNSEALRDYMWNARYFNGGEHPIRHSNEAIIKLNTYIINNIARIFESTSFTIEPMNGFYQAQFYMMKSKMWFFVQSLVTNGTIPRGLIDETEINWFIKYFHMTALHVRGAFVIHPALQGVNLNYYHSMIFEKIQEYIGE